MKLPQGSVAEIAAELARSIPPHPRQQDFVDAAIGLLAAEVRDASPDGSMTEEEAMAGARKEIETGLTALAFAVAEDRFYIVWASAAWSRALGRYLLKAWESEPGAYGSKPPQNYEPKRKPSTINNQES